MNSLVRELEALRKQSETGENDIKHLAEEKKQIDNVLEKTKMKNSEKDQEIQSLGKKIATLTTERNQLKKDIFSKNEVILALERERDKSGHDAANSKAKLVQIVEELKLKKNLISELKKENAELDAKLKQQQNLYEAVRSDRNSYSKSLIETQDEVAELKRKFKVANHTIFQLKEEIQAKDIALTNENFELSVITKQKDAAEANKADEEKKRKEAESLANKLQQQIQKLEGIIKEAEVERDKLKKDHDDAIQQRDTLGTQLIRRNDELALLYEKIKILQSTLSKGETQYKERLEDIRLLQFTIADLKSELRIVKKSASQISDLRKEVYNLQQQLLNERLQVKALSEELENPLNYHRWRKLEGTDPDSWEMILKIQTLQKRLIKKTEEVVEKDVIIQEKEKLYNELKNILARQPGPEVAEQLSIYQQNLKEKTRQMKAMAAELNMYQAQVNEYKYEIERLTRELQDMKRRYFEQKRRDKMQKDQQRAEMGVQQRVTAPTQAFVGGGFNLGIQG